MSIFSKIAAIFRNHGKKNNLLPITTIAAKTDGGERTAKMYQPKSLSKPEAQKLLACARASSPRDHCLVMLMMICGLRTVEIERARVDCILVTRSPDGQPAYLLKVWGKGRKAYDRHVFLPPDVYAAINAYVLNHLPADCECLFIGQEGGCLKRRSIRYVTSRLFACAGIVGHSAHHLRHTAATFAMDAGASLADVQHMLRHRSEASTEIYTEAAIIRRRAAAPAEAKAAETVKNITSPKSDERVRLRTERY